MAPTLPKKSVYTQSEFALNPEIYLRHRGVPVAPVLEGLQNVLEMRAEYPNLNFSVNCVVTRLNLRELPALVEYCSQRGVAIGFQPLHAIFASDTGDAEGLACTPDDSEPLRESIQTIITMKRSGYQINNQIAYLEAFVDLLIGRQLPQEFSCRAGFTSIAVDHLLNVKSCWPMPPIGNLRFDDLPTLWKSNKYRQRRKAMLQLSCPRCWLRCHTEYTSEQEFVALFA